MLHTEKGVKGNAIQGSTAHSNSNPGVLYQTPHCSADIKSASLTVVSLGTLASFFKPS